MGPRGFLLPPPLKEAALIRGFGARPRLGPAPGTQNTGRDAELEESEIKEKENHCVQKITVSRGSRNVRRMEKGRQAGFLSGPLSPRAGSSGSRGQAVIVTPTPGPWGALHQAVCATLWCWGVLVPFSSLCVQNKANLCVCVWRLLLSPPSPGFGVCPSNGVGQVQDQEGVSESPTLTPLATWEATRIHAVLNASHAFPQLFLPIQRAVAHFTEKKMEAGKGSNSSKAIHLKRGGRPGAERGSALGAWRVDFGQSAQKAAAEGARMDRQGGLCCLSLEYHHSQCHGLSVSLSPVCFTGWSLSLLG